MFPDFTAPRAGGITWAFNFDRNVPPKEQPAAREAAQRLIIRTMVRHRYLIVLSEAQLTACPRLIAWSREEHAAIHPDGPWLVILVSNNAYVVWDRPKAVAPSTEYWPVQMAFAEECIAAGWLLMMNGRVVRLTSTDGHPIVVFDIRNPACRARQQQLYKAAPWAPLNGTTDPNRADGWFHDEPGITGAPIGVTGLVLPEGWTEAETNRERGFGLGMLNGPHDDTAMTLGRYLQNAEGALVSIVIDVVYCLYRPQRLNVLHFRGDPTNPDQIRRCAAVASVVGAFWQLGGYADPVSDVVPEVLDGRMGLAAEYLTGHNEAVNSTGVRIFQRGMVTVDPRGMASRTPYTLRLTDASTVDA